MDDALTSMCLCCRKPSLGALSVAETIRATGDRRFNNTCPTATAVPKDSATATAGYECTAASVLRARRYAPGA